MVRKTFGDDLFVGASTHSLEEAKEAEGGGADFIVFGPVYETESKRRYGDPVGVEALRRVVDQVRIPVLAIGGITLANVEAVMGAGAKGIAAISLFTNADDLHGLVRSLKGG